MAALINDIDTLRSYGVKVNMINEDSSLADIEGAQLRFLLPLLGQTLYDSVVAVGITDSPLKNLVDLCCRAVAPLAYWMDLPFLQTNISDKGIGTFESDNMQAAHRWEFEQLRDALADKGCQAIETLLQHLFDNKTTYNWALPVEYKTSFLTGKEFSKYFPLFQPYRTFENLRPLVVQVEDQYIRPTIGDAFFEELRDKTAPSEKDKRAIYLLKKAVANLTIKTAIEVLPVKLSVDGFTVLLQATEKANQGEEAAPGGQLDKTYASVDRSGESYLVHLKEFLNANASDFATFKASSYYKPPVAAGEERNPNACSKIFGL